MTHQITSATHDQTTRSERPTTGPLQRHRGSEIPSIVHEVLRSPGHPLDPSIRSEMEPRFGYDFSRVRVHADAKAADSARALHARAYTAGRDIVFAGGPIASDPRGRTELLAHELAHVVQQGGRSASQVDDLVMTRPGDAAEREAHSIAQAVAGDRPFAPPANRSLALARQPDAGPGDAGVPADAGPAGGSPGAGPVAGPPGPGGAPAAPARRRPAPAPAAPTAVIGAVTFRGSQHRVAPTQTATVQVNLSNLPSGGSAAIDVEGSGGVNGTATITAGASLAGTGAVTVRGDTQTTPGNARGLRLRARLGGTVIGRSPGFTVAAWPADFTISRNADIDTPTSLGLRVNIGCVSDGSGALAELSEAEHTERVDIASRDNPPFTKPGAISATGTGTSGFMAATSSPLVDRHGYARADINTTGLANGFYTLVYRQNFLFNDRRTGVTNRVVQNSGFTITHGVVVAQFPLIGRVVTHMTTKQGAAVTVESKATTAGAGTATSDVHSL